MDHYDIFKEKEKIASNIVFKAKELSFRNFINSINSETTSKEVWGKLNALSKKFSPRRVPFIYNHNLITSALEKANTLSETLQDTFGNVPDCGEETWDWTLCIGWAETCAS